MINTYDPATMNTQAIRELTGEVTKLKIETNVLSEQIEDVEAEIPELPTPAVADAGKVLSVSESGEYELGEGGGGGDVFVITPTYELIEDEPTVTFDKTYTEVSNAITNNKVIMFDDTEEGVYSKLIFNRALEENGVIMLRLPPLILKDTGNTLTVILQYFEMDSQTSEVTEHIEEYTVATTT